MMKKNIDVLLEIPSIVVSEEAEPTPEGSSGECMGPPSVAGTSSETTQPSEPSEDMLEGEDGVCYLFDSRNKN